MSPERFVSRFAFLEPLDIAAINGPRTVAQEIDHLMDLLPALRAQFSPEQVQPVVERLDMLCAERGF